MSADSEMITAVATCIGVGVGVIGLGFTGWQLRQLKNQVRLSNLTNVLALESEINDRKEKVDEITRMIGEGNSEINIEEHLEAAVENWINSVDRLCFCIRKGYFPEKEWSIEYRDYILGLVRANEDKFGAGSRYVHIINLNSKWKEK